MKGIFSISKSILEPGVSRKVPTYDNNKKIVVDCMKSTSSNEQIVSNITECYKFLKDYSTCFDLYNREEINLIHEKMKLCILEDLITYSEKCQKEMVSRPDKKCPELYKILHEKYRIKLTLRNNK